MCSKCHQALQGMTVKEAHILWIPFITIRRSQISHRLPVPDHATVLLSPSPLVGIAVVSGVWHLTQRAAGELVVSTGMGMWDSFQESDRPITR